MSKNKSFVFNDQNQKNSYGFRILTSGIDTKRFMKNPVMLNDHWNSTRNVMGSWENTRVEKDLLLGDPIFDTEDDEAAKLAGKVERGFVKSCSMGITFSRENLKIIGDELIMEKCELYEVSIVAVPSNSNSIRLYSESGELMKDEDVQQLCLSLQSKPDEPESHELNFKPTMKKILLSVASLAALSLDTTKPEQDESVVDAAILKLKNERDEANSKVLAFETKEAAAAEKTMNDAIDLAIKEGKIPATKKEDFQNLGKSNLSLMLSTLESIPGKASLTATLITASGGPEVKTKEDFQKLSLTEQLAFKTDKPEEYKKLFNIK